MTSMVGSPYVALKSVVDDDRARRAAEDVAYDRRRMPDCKTELPAVRRGFAVLAWMLAFNNAMTVAILFRLFA